MTSETSETRPAAPSLPAGGRGDRALPGGPGPAQKGRGARRRLAAAFAVAIAADLASVVLEVAPPLGWIVDVATALALFVLLGRQWALLPALVAEAIPGLAVFPFWTLVVGAIALWGSIGRPGRERGADLDRR